MIITNALIEIFQSSKANFNVIFITSITLILYDGCVAYIATHTQCTATAHLDLHFELAPPCIMLA